MSHAAEDLLDGEFDDWALLAVRLAVGIPLFVSGVGKVLNAGPKATGIDAFAGFLTTLGVPLPGVFAWIVGLVELGGGLLLLVGLLSRLAALLVATDMLVAMVLVHLPNGYPITDGGVELTLTLLLLGLAVTLSGPGKLSAEHALFGRELLARLDDRTVSFRA